MDGTQGRSNKDTTVSMAGKGLEQKAKAYGSSELLVEINSIISRFTKK
jgi:hypothetical protein